MIIKKGQKLKVIDNRKGTFNAQAIEDFDTTDEWYQVVVDQEDAVAGASNGEYWFRGDKIPCRKGIATIKIRK